MVELEEQSSGTSHDVLKSYIFLHISVVLWSFTAILGDLITMSAVVLVWWRVAITSGLMIALPRVLRSIVNMSRVMLLRFLLIGAVVALHWVCFYGAIKLANASVALICMSTTTLFTSFIEPWVSKRSISWLDVLFGCLVIPGIFLTTQGLSEGMMIGFWVGIMSAILAALFAVFNKRYIDDATPRVITTIEMIGALLFMSLIVLIRSMTGAIELSWPSDHDWILLLILAIGCTIIPYIMHLKAYEHLTAFASNLVVNLEPVYGILLAIFILNDHKELSTSFYIGVLLIFIVVMIYPVVKKRAKVRRLRP